MRTFLGLLLAFPLFLMSACGTNPGPETSAPTAPTNTPAPTIAVAGADTARGRQVWLDKQCTACHGDTGQGGIGPTLLDTVLPFDQFLHKVRTALPPKPAFNATELSDQDTYNIYAWLQGGEAQLVAAESTAEPLSSPELAEGEVLGMMLWTQYECDSCHGAFAQGSAEAPALAGLTYPYEMERANMRLTEAEIPEHSAEHIRDVILKRLYNWLQAGADPQGGC